MYDLYGNHRQYYEGFLVGMRKGSCSECMTIILDAGQSYYGFRSQFEEKKKADWSEVNSTMGATRQG
jgi:hypothetical protein